MLQYLGRRLLAMIPTLLGITFITFLMINLAPGDPVALTMGVGDASIAAGSGGGRADTASQAIKAKKQLLGILDKDFAVRVWDARAARDAFRPPETDAERERWRAGPLVFEDRLGEFSDWPHALAATGGGVCVGTENGTVELLADDGSVAATCAGMDGQVGAVAVSDDGRTVAAANVDGRILVWDAAGGAPRAQPETLGKPVRDLAFLGADRLLSACDDGVVRVHDARDGRVLRELTEATGFVGALAAARDGSRFWTGGFDRKLREYDAATFTVRGILATHQQAINDLALSADGRLLASAADDRLIRVFDLTAPEADPHVLKGHYKEATAVAFSPDGRTVWSGARDETIRGWDLETGLQFAQVPEAAGKVHALAVSPDGSRVWSASESWTKSPVWKRYVKWLGKIVTLDLGTSLTDERSVAEKIGEALPVTMGINALAIAIIYLIAIPVGVHAAVKRGGLFDNVASVILFLLYSLPSFWVATLLIMTFSSERNWNVLPCVGLHASDAQDLSYLNWLWDWAKHLVLPIAVGVYGGFAGLSRYARTSLLETISQDYVRTARAKGLPESRVVYRHALRNSLVPIVTLLGNLLPGMIGGSVILEYIFNIHGMGWLGFDAILERDYPVIMAVTTMSAFLTLLGILVSDILYTLVDPRITHS